jgi:enoyl reductase
MRAQAVRFHRYGGPEVLRLDEVELAAPGPGEVLVAIRAAGVNPVDWKIRNGWRAYGRPLDAPVRVGLDGAGIVEAVGEGVEGLRPGDEVIGSDLPGSYATHVVAPAGSLVPKPAGVPFEEGAAIGVPVGTAFQALRTMGLAAGETLLVHAGAGGVGLAAVQLGRLWGARVIATAGPGNQDRLRELGADPVVYGDGLLDRLRALAPGGVDVVLEAAGTEEAVAASLALAHDRQRIGEVGRREWRDEFGIRAWSASAPGFLDDEERRLRAEAVPYAAGLVATGELVLPIRARLPLAAAAEAQRQSEAGHGYGKIVLIPGADDAGNRSDGA